MQVDGLPLAEPQMLSKHESSLQTAKDIPESAVFFLLLAGCASKSDGSAESEAVSPAECKDRLAWTALGPGWSPAAPISASAEVAASACTAAETSENEARGPAAAELTPDTSCSSNKELQIMRLYAK